MDKLKLLSPIVLVPQQHIYILERMGRFSRQLSPGFNFKLPLLDAVAFTHSLKEIIVHVDSQNAITKDNVKLRIDGVLYYKITDALKASYEIANPSRAINFLAQTSMRSEIGKMELDQTFKEREVINANIKAQLREACLKWGVDVMRYEIKDL